jgi:putative membrane protein
MSVLFAFLHFLAAFALVAALAAELVLLGQELSPAIAKRLQAYDIAYAVSAGIILIAGFMRVFAYEKGADYYFHSVPFLIKLTLFIVVALVSIYPTVRFIQWKKAYKAGRTPVLAPDERRRLRLIVHAELTGVMILVLCASLMARGVGFFG